MAKYKSLLVGHAKTIAGKARKCYHSSKHRMQKGDVLLEVRDGMAWKGYCVQCAAAMIVDAEMELTDLRQKLGLQPEN